MNVCSIGSPCSGKTTTAALVFAELKDQGTIAEFVLELARQHIAKKKQNQALAAWIRTGVRAVAADEVVDVGDKDQFELMFQQTTLQVLMSDSLPASGVVISDASPISSLCYMTPAALESEELQLMLPRAIEAIDLLLFSHPINTLYAADPNRVHTVEQSLAVHNAIPGLLQRFAPNIPVVELFGKSSERKAAAIRAIYERLPL